MGNNLYEMPPDPPDIIDGAYFQELAGASPGDICRRTRCRYDAVERSYQVSAWGDEYTVSPHRAEMFCLSKKKQQPHAFFFLFIIYYLLRSKEMAASGKWISEKDLPGGATFFRGPHEIPTRLMTERYGNDMEAFRKKCTQCHGLPLDMADAAYRFDIMPNIPVAVLYWGGDDEFPSEASILYDKTISEHLTADIIFALAVEICVRIGAA